VVKRPWKVAAKVREPSRRRRIVREADKALGT
jgi:hypothetical protein